MTLGELRKPWSYPTGHGYDKEIGTGEVVEILKRVEDKLICLDLLEFSKIGEIFEIPVDLVKEDGTHEAKTDEVKTDKAKTDEVEGRGEHTPHADEGSAKKRPEPTSRTHRSKKGQRNPPSVHSDWDEVVPFRFGCEETPQFADEDQKTAEKVWKFHFNRKAIPVEPLIDDSAPQSMDIDAERFRLLSDKLKEAFVDQGRENVTKLQATLLSGSENSLIGSTQGRNGHKVRNVNRDCIVISQTGSGKTEAYLAAAIQAMISNESLMAEDASIQARAVPRVLILCPTRELAIQVYKTAIDLLRYLPQFRTVVLYGGPPMRLDVDHLAQGCQVLIATPGRLLAHASRKRPRLSLALVRFHILDGAKCLLHPKFDAQLSKLNKLIGGGGVDTYRWLFTSGFDKDEALKAKSMVNEGPTEVEIESNGLAQGCLRIEVPLTPDACVHPKPDIIDVTGKDRIKWLRDWLLHPDAEAQRIMILANNADHAEAINQEIYSLGIKCVLFSSKHYEQRQRETALNRFKYGETGIAITTQRLGQGLEIPFVGVVVFMRMPRNENIFYSCISSAAMGGVTKILYDQKLDQDLGASLRNMMDKQKQECPLWFKEAITPTADNDAVEKTERDSESDNTVQNTANTSSATDIIDTSRPQPVMTTPSPDQIAYYKLVDLYEDTRKKGYDTDDTNEFLTALIQKRATRIINAIDRSEIGFSQLVELRNHLFAKHFETGELIELLNIKLTKIVIGILEAKTKPQSESASEADYDDILKLQEQCQKEVSDEAVQGNLQPRFKTALEMVLGRIVSAMIEKNTGEALFQKLLYLRNRARVNLGYTENGSTKVQLPQAIVDLFTPAFELALNRAILDITGREC